MTPGDEDELEVDLFGQPIAPPPPGEATRGRRGALTATQWRTWLEDAALVERYLASIYWRGEGECAYWLGTISSSGHGKFRLGSYTDDSRRVVTAHLVGYQRAHGALEDSLGDVVIGHTCDESSCQNPHHMEVISRAANDADYRRRKHQWPLADVRGARGRAVALRDAVRTALSEGLDVEAALAAVDSAGRPPPPTDVLF